MTVANETLWTVARFPDGSWATGGKSTDPDYSECEVFLIWASNRDEAKRRGQARRAQIKAREKRAAARLEKLAREVEGTPAVEPQALFDYACEFNRKARNFGRAQTYPTFREAAKHFGVKLADIEQACEDWDHTKGYMKPGVASRSARGVSAYTTRGNWLVEAYV